MTMIESTQLAEAQHKLETLEAAVVEGDERVLAMFHALRAAEDTQYRLRQQRDAVRRKVRQLQGKK